MGARVVRGYTAGTTSTKMDSRARPDLVDWLADGLGFIMDAFEFGAPPHGGMAFGFDRLVAITGGAESSRDFIAFPKNNAGRDTMIESPSVISGEQLEELSLAVKPAEKDA